MRIVTAIAGALIVFTGLSAFLAFLVLLLFPVGSGGGIDLEQRIVLLSLLLLGPPAAIYLSYLSGKAFHRSYFKPAIGSVTVGAIIRAISLLPTLIVAILIMTCIRAGFINVMYLLFYPAKGRIKTDINWQPL